MPDLSDTVAKCRMGTAKNFTLLLLLYHTQVNTQGVFYYFGRKITMMREAKIVA